MTYVETEEKEKVIGVRHLLALCEIENFDIFRKELEELIISKRPKKLINKVYRIMRGKVVLGNKKIKDFVKRHQNTVDVLNKYHITSNLTICSYDDYGRKYPDFEEDYFLEFINSHKDEVETIKNVVQRIYQLGFDKIYYDEKCDFTNIEYRFGRRLEQVQYLENMEIIPTYDNRTITYKTNGSCYCMSLGVSGIGDDKYFSEYSRKIKLNSLIFEPSRLPDEITYKTIVGSILELAKENEQEGKIIRELVDVSVAIDDLVTQYDVIKKVVETVDNVKNKDELKQVLNIIMDEINKLKTAEMSLRQNTISDSKKLSEEKINEEKRLYIRRRELNSIHDSW